MDWLSSAEYRPALGRSCVIFDTISASLMYLLIICMIELFNNKETSIEYYRNLQIYEVFSTLQFVGY